MRNRKDDTDLLWKKYENFIGIKKEAKKKRVNCMNTDLFFKLINLSGPSGSEGKVRELIKKEIKPYVSSMNVDKFGNLIAHKKGKKPTVMLTAHMDEIGVMIKNIDELGWIYCSEIGGVDPVTLLGERVRINTNKDPIVGIITTKDIMESGYQEAIPKMSELVIITGLEQKELEKLGVEVGDYLHLMFEATYLGSKRYVAGKAMDDRVGCFMVLELAKRLKNVKNELYYVFTVQEEVGLYGAKTSVYMIDPDWALVLDVTDTDDFAKKYTKCLDKGPTITIKDSEMIGNRCINGWFKALAKKHKIPLQYDISDFGTTDALSISVARGGIPTGVLGVPVRNIHTPSSVVCLNDMEHGMKLIELLMKNPPKSCVL